jgi:hypothetical protein
MFRKQRSFLTDDATVVPRPLGRSRPGDRFSRSTC